MTRFADSDLIAAVQATSPTRGQMDRIAAIVGCSKATAIKRVKALAARDGATFEIEMDKAYDSQGGDAGRSGLFGGAGACVRRFLIASMIDREARLNQYDS